MESSISLLHFFRICFLSAAVTCFRRLHPSRFSFSLLLINLQRKEYSTFLIIFFLIVLFSSSSFVALEILRSIAEGGHVGLRELKKLPSEALAVFFSIHCRRPVGWSACRSISIFTKLRVPFALLNTVPSHHTHYSIQSLSSSNLFSTAGRASYLQHSVIAFSLESGHHGDVPHIMSCID